MLSVDASVFSSAVVKRKEIKQKGSDVNNLSSKRKVKPAVKKITALNGRIEMAATTSQHGQQKNVVKVENTSTSTPPSSSPTIQGKSNRNSNDEVGTYYRTRFTATGGSQKRLSWKELLDDPNRVD